MNLLRLRAGYCLSRIAGKPVQLGMPFSMSIEPTTSCNLRCPQCPSGLRSFTRETGMLSRTHFEAMIDEAAPWLHSLTLYFQGEPFLNPGLGEMIAYASKRRLYTITSTNAHFLNPEQAALTVRSGLDKLIISVDGVTQASYAEYRVGGSLAKVLDGTKNIVAAKRAQKSSTPHVVWQFVVFRHNEHEIPLLKKMAREAGADEVRIKTAQVYDQVADSQLIPLAGEYARYVKDASGNYVIDNDLRNKCWRMWQGCVVTWDGKVVPCCFDKDASHQVGNLLEDGLEKVWFSPAYNSFRQSVLLGRKEIDICVNCSEGSKVWI